MKEFIEKLIGRLEELKDLPTGCSEIVCDRCRYTEGCWEGEKSYKVTVDKSIEIVNELAEEYNNGWIACSERLPKANIVVLVYLKKCYKDKTYYSYDEAYVNEKGYWADAFGLVWGTILAWQPLPAPYEYEEVNK